MKSYNTFVFARVLMAAMALFSTPTLALPAGLSKVSFSELTGEKVMKNGIYTLTYDKAGIPSISHTPLDMNLTTRATEHRNEQSIGARAAGCDNIALDHHNTDTALSNLENTCSGGKFGTTWAVADFVVAFYCQWNRQAVCTRQSALEAVKWVAEACGAYAAGSYSGDGYAYGFTDYQKHDFCNIVLESSGPCPA
ncbi:uncharacterized protein PG998_012836 [Apiospora kogelbergensis]|uniref:uncharacterized protein n=1 Tax=Apiospora kogelbergensis TaxID=1337665 RepID=UPI00313016F5